MGSSAQVFLVLAIASFGAAIVGFWFLSRRGPRGAVLAVAVVLYVISWMIPQGQSRKLNGVSGLIRMIGFTGGILGIVDLVRKPRQRRP
jgi:hypothetical protein